jgi:hypothetical protein
MGQLNDLAMADSIIIIFFFHHRLSLSLSLVLSFMSYSIEQQLTIKNDGLHEYIISNEIVISVDLYIYKISDGKM